MPHSAYERDKQEYAEMTKKKAPEGRWIKVNYEQRISSSAITGVTRMIRESELPALKRQHPMVVVVEE